MAENPYYKELLQLLNEFEVEYLIVGGYAVMKYGEPRYTKDLDVWINNSTQNSLRVVEALKKFGAPLDHDGINAETFAGQQVVYQIGVAPVRIDILTEITHCRGFLRCVEEEGRKQFLRCTGAFHFAGRPFDQQAGFGSKQRSDGPPAESGPWKARGIRHRRLFTLQ